MDANFFGIVGRERVSRGEKNSYLFTMAGCKLEVHHKKLFCIASLHTMCKVHFINIFIP